jgi:hypothetical protein
MKYLYFGILVLNLSSCSSLKKQKLFSGLLGSLIGGSVGATLGKNLAPDEQSINLNKTMGAAAGAGAGIIVGTYLGGIFWETEPKNFKKNHLFFNKEEEIKKAKTKFKVLKPKNPEVIKLESKIPDFLKGKIKEAKVMTYDIDDYQEEMEDGRIIHHEKHKAFEYIIE